jgi:putative hydrolase of the HAD superfamily
MSEIKGVYFDWGGVLFKDPFAELMQRIATEMGVGADELNVPDDLVFLWQTGALDEPEFWLKLLERSNLRVKMTPRRIWGKHFEEVYQEFPEMIELTENLKARDLKIGLLSNTEMPGADFFETLRYKAFDYRVYSCRCGFAKPDPRIFEYAADKMGLQPDQIVYFDDKIMHVESAAKVGFRAKQFRLQEDAIQFLADQGIEV